VIKHLGNGWEKITRTPTVLHQGLLRVGVVDARSSDRACRPGIDPVPWLLAGTRQKPALETQLLRQTVQLPKQLRRNQQLTGTDVFLQVCIDDVPGISSMFGERRSGQASATRSGKASRRCATLERKSKVPGEPRSARTGPPARTRLVPNPQRDPPPRATACLSALAPRVTQPLAGRVDIYHQTLPIAWATGRMPPRAGLPIAAAWLCTRAVQ
jgi:hypothetical protein